MIHEQSLVICKGKRNFECLDHDSNSLANRQQQEVENEGKESKRTKTKMRRILIEMLFFSDLILLKALRLHEESKLLLETLVDDTLGAPM